MDKQPHPAAANEQPKWRPGIELSSWPEMKFARAVARAQQLQAEVNMWNAGAPVSTDQHISDGGLTATVVLRVRPEPPVQQWALTLGEILHNLRGALDALTWELVHLDGGKPRNPKAVQFPCATSEEAWKKATDVLGSMPTAALDRLRQVQPVAYPEAAGARTLVQLLVELSNQDKHRSSIEASVVGSELALRDVGLEFADEESATAFGEPRMQVAFGEMRDGVTLVRIQSPVPIKAIKAPLMLGAEFQLVLDGERFKMGDAINDLLTQVRGSMNFIYAGPPGEAELGTAEDDEGWKPFEPEIVDSLDDD